MRIHLLILSFIFLLLAVAIYILFRSEESTMLLPRSFYLGLGDNLPVFIKLLLGILPSFLHTISFIILLVLFYAETKTDIFNIAFFWIMIEIFFEILQLSSWTTILKLYETQNNILSFILPPIIAYSEFGFFSIGDIFAIISGGIIAFFLCNKITF